MRRGLLAMSLIAVVFAESPVGRSPAGQGQAPPPVDVKYESIAQGVQVGELFRTEALRDVTVQVQDVIVGPGKSAGDVPTRGFAVTELKAGDLETTIDGERVQRKPGSFWLVRPEQKYAIKSLGGPAVLHVIAFTRR